MLDRGPDGQVYRRTVHFAEPGAGTKDLALGLMPGDRLVEINSKNVENRSRDEIVEMIRQSGDTVRLKVQPILELNELSRSWLRNHKGIRRDTFDLLISSIVDAFEIKQQPDIVILTESNLTNNVPGTTIAIPGYVLSHQQDRPSKGAAQ
eukprot:g48213.t1